jgi:transcriptional regulator with XRE-family HTH domain
VIRRLREQAGYSQDRFGAVVGIHRTYAGLLELGKTGALGLSVAELLTLATNEEMEAKPTIAQTKVGPVRRVAEPSDRKPNKAKRRNTRRRPQ